MDYAFSLWAFRKIYLETIEYDLTNFEAGLRRVAKEEGRLRDHVFFGDRHWDVVTSAVYRDAWRDFRSGQHSQSGPLGGAAAFDEFFAHIAAEFDLEDGSPQTRLIEDFGIDSLQLAELVVVVCDLAHAPDPDELPDLETLGDVHRWYLALVSGREDGSARGAPIARSPGHRRR